MALPHYPNFTCSEDSCVTSISSTLFGEGPVEVTVLLEDGFDAPSRRQLDVIEFLRSLSPAISEDISASARDYFRHVDAAVGLANEGIHVDEQQISQHYTLEYITVPKLGKCGMTIACIGACCDWEPEHGMHILLVNNTIPYCGSCSTLFYGKGWRRILTAEGEETQLARLNEHLAAVPR
jgi:hypothetical protein